jgi:hypothetical protein
MAAEKKPASNTPSVVFETTLLAFGNNTGIEVPATVIDQLGAGRRPPVSVDMNGHVFRTTVGVMSGKHLIPVSAAVRKDADVKAGDELRVSLSVAATPREVDIPADFAAALAGAPEADAFFGRLSNSLQRFHIDNINGAKTDDTRQRRIEKAVALFLDGKQR